ncbi:MAG: translocation/assembly module TamB domain-containing protein, partial [Desulfobulbus sp.]|nr:translocation/assembly module TamB domain-containing protein [Desulfobulbus sp.]
MFVLDEGRLGPATWQGEQLTIDELALVVDTATLRVRGQLRTAAGYPLDLAFDGAYTSEDFAPFAGSGTVQGPLAALEFELAASAPIAAQLQGLVHDLLAEPSWEARVDSDRVALTKINPTWPDQMFTNLHLAGSGTFSDYRAELQTQVANVSIDRPVELSAHIAGNLDGLTMESIDLSQEQATLSLQGRLDWSPVLAWQAEVVASQLDPSVLLADWPGDFQVRLRTEGQLNDQLEATLHLDELQGQLRGLPLTGTGEAQLHGSTFRVEDFTLASGDSTLRVSGGMDEQVDLAVQLDSANLAEFWPNAGGTLSVRGNVRGTSEAPQLDLTLTGTELALEEHRVKALTLKARGGLWSDAVLEADLQAQQLLLGGLALDTGQAQLRGSVDNHSLAISTEGADLTAGLTVQGGVSERQWRGRVQLAHLMAPGFGSWQQEQPAALVAAADRAELQPLCLSGSSGQFCVQGDWAGSDGAWQMQATTTDVHLAALAGQVDLDGPLQGLMNATLELAGSGPRLVRGALTTSVADMALVLDLGDGGTQQVQWRTNVLRADYANERLQTVLDSELKDGSRVHLDLAMDRVIVPGDDLATRPLNGALQVELSDLTPLTALAGQLALFSGRLRGDVTIAGTLTAPEVTGTVDLEDGKAEIPQLGITLAPLQVAMRGAAGQLAVQAMARSGEGELQAESVLHLDGSGVRIDDITVRGDGFQAAALPGLELVVSPDLRITLAEASRQVSGTVHIPKARITSVDFGSSISASDDMVVIDDPDHAAADEPSLPLETTVRLVTGDDVRIDAYGLRGRIAGDLELSGRADRPLTGKGTLSVQEASFALYGRRLQIDVGRLLFTGGTLTNPGIELRSEKRDANATVGLVAGGFLQSPELSFYSHPYMEQSVILTRLLENTSVGGETREETGLIGDVASMAGLGGLVPYLEGVKKLTMIDDVSLETGDGYDDLSLVFGSWLTPKLYVSYGKNMLEESGTFNTRYLLGKGFSILTETGPSQSG